MTNEDSIKKILPRGINPRIAANLKRQLKKEGVNHKEKTGDGYDYIEAYPKTLAQRTAANRILKLRTGI